MKKSQVLNIQLSTGNFGEERFSGKKLTATRPKKKVRYSKAFLQNIGRPLLYAIYSKFSMNWFKKTE